MTELSVLVHEQDHIQGPDNAAVTLVEYGDFQCPTCGQAYPIVKQVQEHFGDRLRFVFRHFPLGQHPMAEPAAEASEFAAHHKRFWEMHDAIYENQDDLGMDLLLELARNLHLGEKGLEQSIAGQEFSERIDSDLESGEDSGVQGTPTFFINGRQHDGSFGTQQLIAAIEAASNSGGLFACTLQASARHGSAIMG